MQAQSQIAGASSPETKPATTFKTGTPTRHVHSLRPHPNNPRDDVRRDDPKIIEMAESIKRHGILEPLVVTPDDFIIAGHRRRMAAIVAGLDYVPVVIRDVAPEDAVELMLTENMQRESLTALEEARAMHFQMELRKLTVADLARRLSIAPATISQRLDILKLEPEVQRLYSEEELPLQAAPFLSRIGNAEAQVRLGGLLARRQVTFGEFKKLVLEEKSTALKPEKKRLEDVTAADIPSPRPVTDRKKQSSENLTAGVRAALTRAEAMANLHKALSKTISLVSFKTIIDTTCCSCGMEGNAAVCLTCPLPRIIQGVVGRAD
jgi:ParB family chromosome partitioning protein